ncbi:hypothetical protein CRM22_010896 [Opisthorchis felineus]|uniref:Peptidase A1 domain-containing protein n=1 Tax=Opisthorchis felineus TaxID=147828 RepID=A0A4S2KJY0_OPIFE|nr:hypothetical protein CRM22_010896 [Opisthorchis felineus]
MIGSVLFLLGGVLVMAVNCDTFMRIPLQDIHQNYYVADLSVGNPPVTYKALIDTGSCLTWIPSRNMRKFWRNILHGRWRTSSTEEATGHEFVKCYVADEYRGILVRETIGFPGTSSANVIIGKVQEDVGRTCRSNPFEGIVGLCYDTDRDETQPKLMDQLVDKLVIERPIFSIWLNPEKKNNRPPGYLVLGGIDPSFHVGKLFYVDASGYDPQLWTVMIDGIQVGESKFIEDGTFAVIDSGSPWIQISPDSLKEIHQIVKPIRFSDGFHFVDCSTMLQLPVIHFLLLGGQRLSLEPQYYVFKDEAWGRRTLCYLRIRQPTAKSLKTMIFGIPLLKKYYTVFDQAAQKVGFAPANPYPNMDTCSSSVL